MHRSTAMRTPRRSNPAILAAGMALLGLGILACAASPSPVPSPPARTDSAISMDDPEMQIDPPVPTPLLAMSFRLGDDGRKWKTVKIIGNRRQIDTLMVPEGQELMSWTEMLSQGTTFVLIPVPTAVRIFVDRMKKSDPDLTISTKSLADGSIVVEYLAPNYDEQSIRRFVPGPDGFYFMAYHARPSHPESMTRFDIWRGIVEQSKMHRNPAAKGR